MREFDDMMDDSIDLEKEIDDSEAYQIDDEEVEELVDDEFWDTVHSEGGIGADDDYCWECGEPLNIDGECTNCEMDFIEGDDDKESF